MAKYIVEQSGPLHGEVEISGAKNAALPILAATVLTDGVCEINEVPRLKDIDVMCRILRSLGARVEEDWDEHTITVDGSGINISEVPYDLVKLMRASIFVMGPLLARLGKATIAQPGGCAIGNRPIDLHAKGLKTIGARVMISDGVVNATADKLTGALVYLDFPSVGATENIMMAATLAEGITIIENAAEEPEIVDLASFMVAAAITRGNVLIKNCVPDHVRPVIAKLLECGAVVQDELEGMRVRGDINKLTATDIKTLPYPGFPTDMQAPFMALLTTVSGASTVIETVFENRFMHAQELSKMGANIRVDGRVASVPGDKCPLEGAQVVSTDLRAGAALVLAGLVAKGTTEVSQIYHVERGYENFVEKMAGLGARIRLVED